jgi:glycosyltransferase involved in cell wall biosynthesis
MNEVLLVTKPLVPPWTDGSKNLARDLVLYAQSTRFHCLVGPEHPSGSDAWWRHAVVPPVFDRIYGAESHYAPSLAQNARVALRLARPDAIETYHFFFAPNPKTSAIVRTLFTFKRRRLVHTVASEPVGEPTFFADTHLAVSEYTAERLRAAGARDVHVVHPGLPPLASVPTPDRARFGLPTGARLVLFAGDLSEGGGAEPLADAVLATPDTVMVLACRPKGAGRAATEARLRARLGARGVFLGVVDSMPTLLASVDVVAMPATSLAGKVDLPLVLLEAMQLGKPVIVTAGGPLVELGRERDGVLVVERRDGALAAALGCSISGSGGPARVRDAFSAERMARVVEAHYSRR